MSSCCNSGKWFTGFGILALVGLIGSTIVLAVGSNKAIGQESKEKVSEEEAVVTQEEGKSLATFGGGCFWCVEAVFEQLDGVEAVSSGYMGGHVKNPTYEQVCDKTTGHAEVVQITYDPEKVSFKKLLEVFFATHDPTTLNKQGADDGPQYRSAVFYHSPEQKQTAEEIIKKLDESAAYPDPIVTEVTKSSTYYLAEGYHQDFFSQNPRQGYCRAVIAPKMAKFKKVFADDLKSR